MKNKIFLQVFLGLMILFSIYQLSFSVVTWKKEREVRNYAASKGISTKQVLDSINTQDIYNLGFEKYTFRECKQRSINLGLDLQGGMNVTLEVSVPNVMRAMAGNTENQEFNTALENAEKQFVGQTDFVTLFRREYEKVAPNGKLAPIFSTLALKDKLPINASNADVYDFLREEVKSTIDRTYQILGTRIDRFGLAQTSIQRLESGRVMVELPGATETQRIRDILQKSAELEFWNTYQSFEGYGLLEELNKAVIRVKGLNIPSEDSKDTSLLGDAADLVESVSDDPLLSSNDTNLSQDDSADLALLEGNIDNDSAAEDNQTYEEFQRTNPILGLIIPNINRENNQWNPGATIGYIKSSDIPKLKSYLADTSIRKVMPRNVEFRYGFKPTQEGGNFYEIFALRPDSKGEPVLDGDIIADAYPTLSPESGNAVSMVMNAQGSNQWKTITTKASQTDPKEAIAIVLDSSVYSAPTVQGAIPNGNSLISGRFTQTEAEDLANILKAGKLPASPRIVEENIVGPTLGKASVRAGLISLAVGFLMVILFMPLYYARAGAFAVISLLINLVLIASILAGFGTALTLPGIAGLVLTIGMAVDANVIIYERIKEELNEGKAIKAAVKQGYKSGLSAILDANITTFIASLILLLFGKGLVASFAFILLVGIFCSLFTAIFVTRLLIERDLDKGKQTTFFNKWSKNFMQNVNFDWVGKRKRFYLISGVILAAGIVSLIGRGVSTGVDFKGGWSYVIQMDQATNADQLEKAIGGVIKENVEVKTYGTDNQYKVTTAYRIDEKGETVGQEVLASILNGLKSFNVSEKNVLSQSKVGATIASDIRRASAWAIILALVGMFSYIVLRFRKWQYGLGATTALFHDVLIIFSLYSLLWGIVPFSLDVDQAFIAAILTLVGYSINDTVIVFDRIREFLGLHKYETDSASVINSAVNKTLSRTVVTSFTTFIVVAVLFFFGGAGLRSFTFALLIGVVVGTYSSICIATPVVVDVAFRKRMKKNEALDA